MKLKFLIPTKAYSINAYYYKSRNQKRREAVEWEMNVVNRFRDETFKKEIEEFKKLFNPEKHGLVFNLIYFYPKNIVLTKEGRLSSRAFDLTNVEKPIVDLITAEYHCTDLCKNLEIDDKHIMKVKSEKGIAKNHAIYVEIDIKELKNLADIKQLSYDDILEL